MVRQVFRMSDRRSEDLITPRPEVVSIDLEEPPEINHQKIINHGHSYLPVIQGDLDHVQGYVRAVDLLAQSLLGKDLDYLPVRRTAQFVPERAPVFDVLERFKRSGSQIAFVVDEFGGIQSLLTHTDILEAIMEISMSPKMSRTRISSSAPMGPGWSMVRSLSMNFASFLNWKACPERKKVISIPWGVL
jgi:putative hemolysin